MTKKYNYKDLDLYKAAKDLVLSVYALLRKFPKEEQYALCDQLRRAAISIPSNIAEGMGRVSTKEQIHFLEIAYGSLREVDCQLDIAKDLAYISDEELVEIENKLILCLSDQEVEDMIERKKRNQNPTDLLEDKYCAMIEKG